MLNVIYNERAKKLKVPDEFFADKLKY